MQRGKGQFILHRTQLPATQSSPSEGAGLLFLPLPQPLSRAKVAAGQSPSLCSNLIYCGVPPSSPRQPPTCVHPRRNEGQKLLGPRQLSSGKQPVLPPQHLKDTSTLHAHGTSECPGLQFSLKGPTCLGISIWMLEMLIQ